MFLHNHKKSDRSNFWTLHKIDYKEKLEHVEWTSLGVLTKSKSNKWVFFPKNDLTGNMSNYCISEWMSKEKDSIKYESNFIVFGYYENAPFLNHSKDTPIKMDTDVCTIKHTKHGLFALNEKKSKFYIFPFIRQGDASFMHLKPNCFHFSQKIVDFFFTKDMVYLICKIQETIFLHFVSDYADIKFE